MSDKKPKKIVRCYHKVWVEMEVAHDLWDHEWDGVEYESIDEAKAVMKEAEKHPRVYNAWLESVSVDEDGTLWEFMEGDEPVKEEHVSQVIGEYTDEYGHSEYGLYGEEN